MGANVSILLKFSIMAIKGKAQLYRGGGQICTSLDNAVPSLGNSKATDICVGWAFGQLYALDCMKPRPCYKATIDFPCHVESWEKVHFATITESY